MTCDASNISRCVITKCGTSDTVHGTGPYLGPSAEKVPGAPDTWKLPRCHTHAAHIKKHRPQSTSASRKTPKCLRATCTQSTPIGPGSGAARKRKWRRWRRSRCRRRSACPGSSWGNTCARGGRGQGARYALLVSQPLARNTTQSTCWVSDCTRAPVEARTSASG